MFPGGFEFGGLLCFPSQAGSDAHYFLPLYADLERVTDDRPVFSLIAMGGKGYLMLTAAWRATDKALEALRQELAARAKVDDPSTIKLAFAPVKVAQCDLLLGDGSGDFKTLASSSTSGMPPYSAVFSVNLTEEQFAGAAAAVNGRAGFLAIEYDATVPTPVWGRARLAPQSALFVPWLRDNLSGGPAGFRSALEAAVEDGLATVSVSLPENSPYQLVTRLYDALLTQATTVLPRMIEGWDGEATAELEVAAELVEEALQPMRTRSDLARLVHDPALVTVAGGTTPSGERAARTPRPLRIRLGFDPAGAPLAWIRVRSGDSDAVLRPPHFRPAELRGDWRAGPLSITTGFTNGAHNHTQDVRPRGESELLLSPAHLGLRMLSVDAEPLAGAGVCSAEISLRYRPPNRSDEQRSTIQFHEGEWASQWWVVTGTASWLQYVEYNWKATTYDGRAVGDSVAPAGSSKIVLSLQGGNSYAAN